MKKITLNNYKGADFGLSHLKDCNIYATRQGNHCYEFLNTPVETLIAKEHKQQTYVLNQLKGELFLCEPYNEELGCYPILNRIKTDRVKIISDVFDLRPSYIISHSTPEPGNTHICYFQGKLSAWWQTNSYYGILFPTQYAAKHYMEQSQGDFGNSSVMHKD